MKITDNISSVKEARVIAISPEWFDIKIEKSAKNIYFFLRTYKTKLQV